jgi:C-methyltransferase C-terminal domain/Putative zinc binding domain/Methyltransferase domain
MSDCVRNTACRACGGSDLVRIIDLGQTPPANAYLRADEMQRSERSYPLAVYFCRTCSLLQLLDVVNPEILFKDYHYLTGASEPLVAHFKEYAQRTIRPFIGSEKELVVDIGGNDGVLLSFVKDFARVLNVDAADNLAPLSEAKGVPFYPAFFGPDVAETLLRQHGYAKVVTGNNVFAHTDRIRDVFAGVSRLIGGDGVFIFEVHWVKHLVDENAFDQIYHEHLCYYSLHALKHLVESSGMRIFNVEIVPMQGKSLRVFAGKGRAENAAVADILAQEQAAGLTAENAFQVFARRVEDNKRETVTLLRSLVAQGKKIAGYGAPAKGNTLLNYYGIGPDVVSYLTDTTPLKQGLYSPGMHIPIVAPERLGEDVPDYILLLAWNFKDAILAKESALRKRGVKFIVTVPKLEVV